MVRTGKDVTDGELKILRVLWQAETATIREVVDQIYDDPTRANYQTTKKLIARLEAKEFVRRDATTASHTFQATVAQNELLERRLKDVADSLCNGSALPLVTCLLESKALSSKERRRLREVFDELKRK